MSIGLFVQWALVGAIVAGSIAYVARFFWRTVHPPKGGGCAGGCGCGHEAPPSESPPESH